MLDIWVNQLPNHQIYCIVIFWGDDKDIHSSYMFFPMHFVMYPEMQLLNPLGTQINVWFNMYYFK